MKERPQYTKEKGNLIRPNFGGNNNGDNSTGESLRKESFGGEIGFLARNPGTLPFLNEGFSDFGDRLSEEARKVEEDGLAIVTASNRLRELNGIKIAGASVSSTVLSDWRERLREETVYEVAARINNFPKTRLRTNYSYFKALEEVYGQKLMAAVMKDTNKKREE